MFLYIKGGTGKHRRFFTTCLEPRYKFHGRLELQKLFSYPQASDGLALEFKLKFACRNKDLKILRIKWTSNHAMVCFIDATGHRAEVGGAVSVRGLRDNGGRAGRTVRGRRSGQDCMRDSGSDTQLRPDRTRMEFNPAAILCSSRWL